MTRAPPMVLAALTEPGSTAVFLLIFGALVGISVLFSRAVDRIGVPIVLLFLVLGMVGGSEGLGRVAFDDYAFAVRIGTAALVLILFDGGLNTSSDSIRQSLGPSLVLATVGVIATAALLTLFARLIGMPWSAALLLGAVVSSTDAASVFAILRGGGLNLRPRLRATLEVESCINDPMAIILTVTIIAVLAGESMSPAALALSVPLQLAIGGGIGAMLGYGGRWLLHRIHLGTVGLYPALTLALAFVSFGLATLVQGSGFLAVYVTAAILGNGPLPYRSGLTRIHDALAWLSQIAMFLMLGLLVFPSQLWDVALLGLAASFFLALVARPLAVALCLAPFRYPLKDVAYLGLVGLRGAVPIILATFPVLAGVPGAERVFNLVFFVVVVSSLFPGAFIRPVTRWLRLDVPEVPAPAAVLEINAPFPLAGELISFYVTETLAVCGATLSEIEFPPGASVALIIRGREIIAARGGTTLEPGDHVYVYCHHNDRPYIELLFGRPEEPG